MSMRMSGARWVARENCRGLLGAFAGLALAATAMVVPATAHAEPAACLSPDPAQWPAPAKPYFMIAFDTSGSMLDPVPSAANPVSPSCPGFPANRIGHGRCAVRQTVQAFSGIVNFGLASYARVMTGCPAGTCAPDFSTCGFANVSGNNNGNGCNTGCGPEPSPQSDSSTRAGSNILVPMRKDTSPPSADNTPDLLSWVDNDCSGNKELFPSGCTPMNGILRDMFRYYSTQWTPPSPIPGGAVKPSPLTSVANGEQPCRSVNVILVTDGEETCDDPAAAIDAAADLYAGFTKDGISWKIKTFVINFGGEGAATADQIASAGGTVAAQDVTNEAELSTALANIIGSSVSPEVCDNTDNNCNGCTDEGFTHYCNVQQTCCNWSTPAQRASCLTTYKGTITAADPDGDLTKLPCTTATQQTEPANWLCFDPKETCDGNDNNCQGGIDEGTLKCGSPAHCASPETCDSIDNDCDGLLNEGLPGCVPCTPTPEICDGCDNDCDGVADDGVAPLPCGLASPPNPAYCSGQLICKPPVNVPTGTCVAGGGFNQCSWMPQATETCDGLDNDCDGTADEGVAAVACEPPGTPGGLVYNSNSQCKKGLKPCNGTCQGFIGPSAEICDGIDNDCDGQIDEGVQGVGQSCGLNQAPCSPGKTACVNGALVCQGGTGPQTEVCDGIDNDCDGVPDDAPLADGPAAGQTGCWNTPGNCCSFKGLTWCPPAGAGCNDIGSLKQPCTQGALTCTGVTGWACLGPKAPSGEVCDGIDNDCNGLADDGNLPMEGETCGSDTGECVSGTLTCTGGNLDCVGDVPPSPEVCDAKDNDCNGAIDNGIPAEGACVPAFNTSDYPSTPTDPTKIHPPCQTGVLQCDGNGKQVCVGGVGPSPEVCDGIDNDCDGLTDEYGPQPSGLNGTPNPFPPPDGKIGDACGETNGQCLSGQLGCLNGQFACIGAQGPAPEECDCLDNDCDGSKDNENPGGMPALCGEGKTCVKSGNSCQCAEKCDNELSVCSAAGQECKPVKNSEDSEDLGFYCVASSPCGDDNCASATVNDINGDVLCAPAGTVLDNCVEPPTCVCKGQNGCQDPCFNVVCSPGLVCVKQGPNAGLCGADNCYNQPCAGCGKACLNFQCTDSACKPDTCPAGQVCKPNADFSSYECVPSCNGVQCAAEEKCVEGVCKATCAPCADGEVCDDTQPVPTCVASKCSVPLCLDGRCCDPLTGNCVACACEGVVCPNGEQCVNGECIEGIDTGTSSATSTSSATGSSTASGAGGDAPAGPTTTVGATGAGGGGTWGLPTGGGGCTCELGAGAPSSGDNGRWAWLALALGVFRIRRRRTRGHAGSQEVAR